ncbi:MAG: universal stress protein [Vulcanimicrobiaceae bacterium]
MFSHILVAWDGSASAGRAFDYAVEIARRFQARVQLVSVARIGEHSETDTERQSSLDEARRFYEQRSAPLIESARRQSITVEMLIVEGAHPAEAIIDTAHRVGADLVLVGRRGLSGVTRFLIGSISDRVARYAPCPVLIINDPQ